MKQAVTLLCLLVCYVGITSSSPRAAQTFTDWSTPMNVSSLNTAANDEYAVLSKDELTIYFTSDRDPGSGGLDLWFATRDSVDLPWNEPQNMGPSINSSADDSLPFLSANEHILYFYSRRQAGNCGLTNTGDIWMTRRKNKHSDWQPPTHLGCTLNSVNTSADDTAPALFNDPETEQSWLYYGSSRPGGINDFDVYKSPLGAHGLPIPGIPATLVTDFSSPGRDTRIFIKKDGLEAFITSNRTGSLGTGTPPSLDIWVSTRGTLSDPWSEPTNLGLPVNSQFDDVAPWLSRDGTTLYFSSNRPGSVGTASPLKRDLWYTTRMKLND